MSQVLLVERFVEQNDVSGEIIVALNEMGVKQLPFLSFKSFENLYSKIKTYIAKGLETDNEEIKMIVSEFSNPELIVACDAYIQLCASLKDVGTDDILYVTTKIFTDKRALMRFKVWTSPVALNDFKTKQANAIEGMKELRAKIVSLSKMFENFVLVENSKEITFETETFGVGDKQRLLDLMSAEVSLVI